MAVRAGNLRHCITFETFTNTPNDRGGFTRTVAGTITRWASIKPRTRPEVFETEQIKGIVSHDVMIRWTDDVAAFLKTEFTFRSRRFQVLGYADRDEKNELIMLLCMEVPADGT